MNKGDKFLQIYRNKLIRDVIFSYIREINQKLEYIPYNYYDFPIQSIINNNNQSHFKDKINLYYKHIINNDNNNNYSELYKYQIGFDRALLTICIRWKGLNLECFKSLYKSFKNEIIFYWNESTPENLTDMLIHNGNYKVLKYINENTNLSTTIGGSINEIKFDFINTPTKKLLKLVNYLFISQQPPLPPSVSDCLDFLTKLVITNRSNASELYQLFFKLLERNFINGSVLKPSLLLPLLELSIKKSDLTMVKLILSKFNQDTNTTKDIVDYELIQIYEYTIKVADFDLFSIKLSSLCSSTLIGIVRVIIKRYQEMYCSSVKSDNQVIQIIDPDIAQLVLEELKFENDHNFQFSHRCIKDDLSNINIFSKQTKWIENDIDILNYPKLLFMSRKGVFCKLLTDINHKESFGGDVTLLKLFQDCGSKKSITNNTIITASRNKHHELLEYILQPQQYSKQNDKAILSQFIHSIINYDELIFNKLLNYWNWDMSKFANEISLAKPKEFEKRIEYLKNVSKINLDSFHSSRYGAFYSGGFKNWKKEECISFLEREIYECTQTPKQTSTIPEWVKGKSRLEIGNLIQVVILVGNIKLFNQLKVGFVFNWNLKRIIFKMLIKTPSLHQMFHYLISTGFFVPENQNQNQFGLMSTTLVNEALLNDNPSIIISILHLLSKNIPFIKSNYLIDYTNLTNEIHLQIFKNCIDPSKRNIDTHSMISYLASINYTYKPSKILLKQIQFINVKTGECKHFNPTTLIGNEHFEIYSKFLKNVGLFDFIFENIHANNNNNSTDSIYSNVKKLEFTF